MDTTIQISKNLVERLKELKLHDKESYEELIWDLIEDRMELSSDTKKAIEDYERDKNSNEKFTSFDEIKKRIK